MLTETETKRLEEIRAYVQCFTGGVVVEQADAGFLLSLVEKLQGQLEAMTEDRGLWREHAESDGMCPTRAVVLEEAAKFVEEELEEQNPGDIEHGCCNSLYYVARAIRALARPAREDELK